MHGKGATEVLGAAALIAAAMATIALIDNGVRYVTPEMGLWQFQVIRGLICCACVAGLAAALHWRLRPVSLWRVALRSAVASLSVVLYFGALALMTINQAGAGLFTAPVFVLILSAVLFGVRVGPVRALAVALGFAGVLIVLRPWAELDAGGLPLPAVALAVAAGVLHAAGSVLTRQLCAGEPTAAITFGHFVAMALWGLAGVVVVAVVAPVAPPGAEGWFLRGLTLPSATALVWTTINALGSVLAIGMIVRAYQRVEPSRITVFDFSFLPFAALWAGLLHAEQPDLATVGGTALIVLGGVLIALRTAPPPPLQQGAGQ